MLSYYLEIIFVNFLVNIIESHFSFNFGLLVFVRMSEFNPRKRRWELGICDLNFITHDLQPIVLSIVCFIFILDISFVLFGMFKTFTLSPDFKCKPMHVLRVTYCKFSNYVNLYFSLHRMVRKILYIKK